MFKNYLKIAFRNLIKQKGYSFINIFGLALGIASCIFIFMWVQDELNYDRYNKNVDSIYRIEQDQNYSGKNFHVNVTPYPSAPVFKDEIPEVVNAARIDYTNLLMRYKDKAIYETNAAGMDPSYLEMFTMEFLKGNKSTALNDVHNIIIDDEVAQKYFGDSDPVGKVLTINNKYDFIVKGVFKKLPENVSLSFNIAFPFEFYKEVGAYNESWGYNNIYTFLQLVPNADVQAVNNKLNKILKSHNPNTSTVFSVAPLTEMHLYSQFGYGRLTGNIQYVYIFSILAVFILLIACINFMNLSTARSSNRTKEIGIRKVIGAERSGLISQFFIESLLLSIIAAVFAVFIVAVGINVFNELTGKQITLSILTNGTLILGIAGITLIAGLIAGSYPAVYLSAFRPTSVLKGVDRRGSKNPALRKILVVFQFSLSVFLIIATVVVYNQLVFMEHKNLGYDKENLIYVQMRGDLNSSYQTIKSEFERTPGIMSVSATGQSPNNMTANGGGAEWDGKDPEADVLIGANFVDYNFCSTMGIKILAGRGFTEDFPGDLISDTDSVGGVLVNEEVVKVMGLSNKQAVGARYDNWGCTGKIVGVMQNFHYVSVKAKIEPMAFALVPAQVNFIVIRLAPGDLRETIGNLESAWNKAAPNYPFEYKFIDDDLDYMYRREIRMLDLLRYFSILAIVIACLGLFGLASFSAEQRTKEMGIRKVLGASEIKLAYLLSREFIILIAVANVVAWSFAYYSAYKWLDDFPYRINISPAYFLTAGLVSLVIAIVTVSYQAIKTARTNPVNSLKYE